MTIDVDKYVDNYIHYHVQRMRYMADYADTIFVPLRDNAINDLKNAASELNIRASMFNSTSHLKAAQALNFADELSNGTLLQDTLNDIAATINTAIDAELAKAVIDDYYKGALSFASLLAQGAPDVRMVKDFLNLLTNALDLAGGYDARLVKILKSFARNIIGKDIRWNPGGAQMISKQQAEIIMKIEDALDRAVDRYKEKGELSAASFRQTIVYIFHRLLGSSLAKTIVARINNEVLAKRVPKILQSLNFRPENGGSANEVPPKNERAEIINTKGMTLDVVSNGTTFTIEIGSNLNYKEVPMAGVTNDLNIVANSTVGDYLMFDDAEASEFAYNIIAHKYQVYSAYSEVISTVAASFLKNTLFDNVNKNQTYQFLLINGKIYPVLSIISNICERTLRFGNIPKMISMESTSDGTNSWLGVEGPDWELAIKRSKMVKKVIDTLKIGLYFNSNVLVDYI